MSVINAILPGLFLELKMKDYSSLGYFEKKMVRLFDTIFSKIDVGSRIRIVNMAGAPEYNGRVGTVTVIDDIGQVHGDWGVKALCPMDGDTYDVLQ